MSRIITISREFGSGGRELGKRLAKALGIPCYDHEIIEMIAKENGFNEDYVANVGEKSIEAAYPLTIGHRFGMQPFQIMEQPIRVAVAQRQIIENFAKQGDCVIVGRAADVILKDYDPLNIFVYADKDSKIERCQRRAPQGEHLTPREIESHMKQIDRNRAQHHQMYSDSKWGDKGSYDLCVNTTKRFVKDLYRPSPSSARTGSTATVDTYAKEGAAMKVRLNDDPEIVRTIREGLKRTGGYCPCRLARTEENKCMCKEFKDQIADPNFEGYCHCRLYYKEK